MTYLIVYIFIGIIWIIINIIQKIDKDNKVKKEKKIHTQKTAQSYKNNDNEEEILKKLRKNIKQRYTEDKNVYETSENDRLILDLQKKYNSKMDKINSIRYNSADAVDTIQIENKLHINNMLSSLDIKNAIIYNAILEPKKINYTRINKNKI
ncbi:hypothetical protein [uncultured Brachyspira sp.]|uniref:hypothetical protein n=1 Tax=uncultured Brachyspira sp. TaxID=221953 RepID=UPI0026381635|nr:hypothetical protein [uncultured Brachyspira sp.]